MSDQDNNTQSSQSADEHASLPSSAGLIAQPNTSFRDKDVVPPSEEYMPPSVEGSESWQLLRSCEFPEHVVNDAMHWAQNGTNISADELQRIDDSDKTNVRAELRSLWGDKYESNLKTCKQFINERLDERSRYLVLNARAQNGSAFGNDPSVLQQILGAATRGSAVGMTGSVDQQIKDIEAFMRKDSKAYFKDEPLQARYRELLAKKGS